MRSCWLYLVGGMPHCGHSRLRLTQKPQLLRVLRWLIREQGILPEEQWMPVIAV